MDPFEELERMALNAIDDASRGKEEEPSHDQIANWQRLFHYSYSDAIDRIQQHRSDLARMRVSDEHWGLVQVEMEANGYDREAYEHKLQLGKTLPEPYPAKAPHGDSGTASSFIFKLEGPLSDPSVIQKSANLSKLPDVLNGVGEEGDAKFCVADSGTKSAIEDWLSREHFSYRPTFIRLSKARKDLSETSVYPTLGVDPTLPQNRPHQYMEFLPRQNEYPVLYFFYGTLGDPPVLSRVLGLSEDPILEPACLTGGIVKTWAGKYKALVNGPDTARVEGWAYQVKTEACEDALRFYETEKYEVVRCIIALNGEEVKGCTFRFIDSSQLS